MKNSTYKNLLKIAKSKGSLAIFGGLILVSCGSQMGGYTETDGVYYDPNKDVIPEGIVLQEPQQNTVDEPYTYQNDSISIIEQNRQNQIAQQNKYKNWNNNQQPQSDWGNYAGTEQNYYYNDWGYPSYGWNSYMGFGWNSWNLGFSWGSPWYSYGYNPYYWDYYWGGYYPNYYGYYGGYYPYYGGYYGYNPYYYGGYYSPRYYNYKRSGADSIVRGNGFNGNHRNITRPNQGFQGNSGFRGNTPRANNNTPSVNQNSQNPNNSGFRSTPRSNNNTPRQTTPRTTTPRQTPTRQYDAPRQSTPSSNWGSGNSNSGGGFRSSGGSSSSGSSNSGGGVRSGGFR